MKIAIQKSGRLNELSNNILLQKNIYLPQQLERKLIIDLPPNKIYLLRDDDIPNLVNLNVADCGIVGNDVLDEYLDQQTQNNIKIVKKLNDQKCRLSIASKTKTLNLNDLNGKTIATSFPNTLRKWLDTNAIKAKIVEMYGSVELAIDIGYSDYICDLVSSGKTLTENNLFENIVIKDVYPVIIQNINNQEDLWK